MRKTTKIIGANGLPTSYGFACGYTASRHYPGPNKHRRVSIRMEHGVYLVVCYDEQESKILWSLGFGKYAEAVSVYRSKFHTV